VGIHRELQDQLIAACDGEPPWWNMAFVHAVREIEHHDVVSLGMFGDKSCDQAPLEWMNQALITREEATKAYMMELIAESDF